MIVGATRRRAAQNRARTAGRPTTPTSAAVITLSPDPRAGKTRRVRGRASPHHSPPLSFGYGSACLRRSDACFVQREGVCAGSSQPWMTNWRRRRQATNATTRAPNTARRGPTTATTTRLVAALRWRIFASDAIGIVELHECVNGTGEVVSGYKHVQEFMKVRHVQLRSAVWEQLAQFRRCVDRHHLILGI